VRDGFAGLHAGLWGLPSTAWYPAGGPPPGEAFAAAWRGALGEGAAPPEHRGAVRHAITRYRLRAEVFAATIGEGWPPPPPWVRCGPPRLAAVPWSSLACKALRRAGVSIEI
jgi:hypothetical protein